MNETIEILIIDDSQDICTLLNECFNLQGNIQTTSVHTGNEAIEVFKKKDIDVALIDIDLPDHDGRDLLKYFIEQDPELLCALITGQDSAKNAVFALKEGAFGYFTKPFVFEEVLHDIREAVEKRNLTRKLTASQNQVVQQEKMALIGQLAAGVAHEINNPVGFINSNLTTLNKYFSRLQEFIKAQDNALLLPSQQPSQLEELRKELKINYVIEDVGDLINESLDGTERIKKIVQDLKLFSRQDSGQKEMADINDTLESALNIAWNELKYKCTVNKDLEALPLTLCSANKISQVFINILVNAAHAIEKQGEIDIHSYHSQGEIVVAINDTGCGMQKEVAAKIFDPFFTTKEAGKGTGLGMSVAAEIIKDHVGRIEVESEPGKGTLFKVMLPVRN